MAEEVSDRYVLVPVKDKDEEEEEVVGMGVSGVAADVGANNYLPLRVAVASVRATTQGRPYELAAKNGWLERYFSYQYFSLRVKPFSSLPLSLVDLLSLLLSADLVVLLAFSLVCALLMLPTVEP